MEEASDDKFRRPIGLPPGGSKKNKLNSVPESGLQAARVEKEKEEEDLLTKYNVIPRQYRVRVT